MSVASRATLHTSTTCSIASSSGLHLGQCQSPSGTDASGRGRQSMWYARSQPSESHSSMLLPSRHVRLPHTSHAASSWSSSSPPPLAALAAAADAAASASAASSCCWSATSSGSGSSTSSGGAPLGGAGA